MKAKGQVAIEFALAFTVVLVFLVLVTKLFVWFCGTIVNRQVAFDQTRSSPVTTATPTPAPPTPPGPGPTPVPMPQPPPSPVPTTPPAQINVLKVDFYNQSDDDKKLKLFR